MKEHRRAPLLLSDGDNSAGLERCLLQVGLTLKFSLALVSEMRVRVSLLLFGTGFNKSGLSHSSNLRGIGVSPGYDWL